MVNRAINDMGEVDMKDIVLIGAGGFAREVTWLIEQNNTVKPEWNILGYIADSESGLLKYPVLGSDEWLESYEGEIYAVCCVGNSELREKIISKYKDHPNVHFPAIISKDAIIGDNISVSDGTIICAGTITTVNVKIGKFVIINLDCTIGHEAVLGDYVTLYPSVNVSGTVTIKENTEIGTGSAIIQGITIGEHTIVGAGSVIIKDIPAYVTAVGVPAKVIKNRKEV